MFWIKTLNKLDKNLNKMFSKIGEDIGTLESEQINIKQRINTISDKVIEQEKKIDAITEFLKSDRNDINALIQIVRKLQSNKSKK